MGFVHVILVVLTQLLPMYTAAQRSFMMKEWGITALVSSKKVDRFEVNICQNRPSPGHM